MSCPRRADRRMRVENHLVARRNPCRTAGVEELALRLELDAGALRSKEWSRTSGVSPTRSVIFSATRILARRMTSASAIRRSSDRRCDRLHHRLASVERQPEVANLRRERPRCLHERSRSAPPPPPASRPAPRRRRSWGASLPPGTARPRARLATGTRPENATMSTASGRARTKIIGTPSFAVAVSIGGVVEPGANDEVVALWPGSLNVSLACGSFQEGGGLETPGRRPPRAGR